MRARNNISIRNPRLSDLNTIAEIDKEAFGEECYPHFFLDKHMTFLMICL